MAGSEAILLTSIVYNRCAVRIACTPMAPGTRTPEYLDLLLHEPQEGLDGKLQYLMPENITVYGIVAEATISRRCIHCGCFYSEGNYK